MGKKDARVDAYIAKAGDFARPVLKHLRKVVHQACPEAEETIKWGFPHFEYKGILCSMAAFKEHCTFGFWKGSLLTKTERALKAVGQTAMGQFGRIRGIDGLPSEKVLTRLIKKAAKLNDTGAKPPKIPKARVKLRIPAYFMEALRTNRQALTTFNNFSPSQKRDYLEWVAGAKRKETRDRRLQTALAWLAEGKVRNWKYIKKPA